MMEIIITNSSRILPNFGCDIRPIFLSFLALLGADTLSVRKPNPMHLWTTIDRMGGDRKKAILIGDTITDSDTAKNANLPCILVSFGPKGSEVKNMKASALLNTYFDLPDLIDTIL